MGTSCTVHEISVKIFETWSEKQLRMANICLFQMTFSRWRAAQIIFIFSRLFLYRILTLCTQNFKVHWPALLVFWQKMPKIFKFFTWKNICIKMLVVFYHFKKESSVFVQKWAQNKSLLLKTFVSLIFIA